MLNGIAPIFLFNFKKLTPSQEASIAKIPIVSSIVNAIGLPPIPLYLDEKLTGIYIDSENKNIDIETAVDTSAAGKDATVNQKGINSTVTINMFATKTSLGLTLFSALADLIFAKVTSKEYSITYLNGAVTVFNGLLHSFSINQSSENDLYTVTVVLSRSNNKTIESTTPAVAKTEGVVDLNTGANIPNPTSGAAAAPALTPPPSANVGGLP